MGDCNGDLGGLLPKIVAEIQQKMFGFLFGLSMFLQKYLLLAEIASFSQNSLFWQESSFNMPKFHVKTLLNSWRKEPLSAEKASFGLLGISAERNSFDGLSIGSW